MGDLEHVRVGAPEPIEMPRWRRRMNDVADRLDRGHRFAPRLTVEALCRSAARRAGVGGIDPPPGLEVLVDSLHREADLNAFGVFGARSLIVEGLVARAGLEREESLLSSTPTSRPQRPLVIVGLNRTGTTFLHRVLCEDPAALWLPFWLTLAPSPVPSDRELRTHRSARILRARAYEALTGVLAPMAEQKHEIGIHEPEEESMLMMQSFTSPMLFGAFSVPSYLDWVIEQDQSEAYSLLGRWLSLYQERMPGERWVLKNPFHLPFLPELVEQFPDARIVMTHRDPVKSVTSTVDLFEQYQLIGTSNPNRQQTTDATLRFCRSALTRAMDALDEIGTDRVLHVHYGELVADPLGTVRRIYEHADLELTDVARSRLQARSDRPRDGAPPKPYSPEMLGLSTDAMRAAFADYAERFDIPAEH